LAAGKIDVIGRKECRLGYNRIERRGERGMHRGERKVEKITARGGGLCYWLDRQGQRSQLTGDECGEMGKEKWGGWKKRKDAL